MKPIARVSKQVSFVGRFMTAVIVLGLSLSGVASAQTEGIMERFDSNDGALPEGWASTSDAWRVDKKSLLADSLEGESYVVFGDPSWENYELTVTATFEKTKNASRWLAVVFRANEQPGTTPWSQVSYRLRSSQRSGVEFAIRTDEKTWSVRAATKTAKDFQLGKARKLRVTVEGTTVRSYLDGKQVLESVFCVDRAKGRVGLGVSGCRARFDDLQVRQLPPSPAGPPDVLHPSQIIAHRGYSAKAPENTLSSAREAIRAGATGSEFDVYRCKDGRIVLMHDATVNRTTNGRGRITELTLAQLRKLDAGAWKGPQWAGEPVPTLDETLALFKNSGCVPVIEIKMKGISRDVVEAVRRAGMIDQATVIAFDAGVVREIRQLEPRLPCAWLSSERPKGTLDQQADQLAESARKCETNILDLHYQLLSKEMIAALHRRGIVVWAWTINDPAVTNALMLWNVDAITTDRPEMVLGQIRDAGKKPGPFLPIAQPGSAASASAK